MGTGMVGLRGSKVARDSHGSSCSLSHGGGCRKGQVGRASWTESCVATRRQMGQACGLGSDKLRCKEGNACLGLMVVLRTGHRIPSLVTSHLRKLGEGKRGQESQI